MGPLDVPLVTGWNLVSIPEEPADTDPAAVLASIAGKYNLVYAYDRCDDEDPWKLYDPAASPPTNDLTAIDHRIGFWIEMTDAAILSVSGTQPTSTVIPLCRGWNLIGYPRQEPLPVAEALASIEGKYTLVFAWDPTDTTDPWEVYEVGKPDWSNDLQVMEPGRGYWVYATEDVTLTMAEPTPTPTSTPTPTPTPSPTPTPTPGVGEPPFVEITSPEEGTEVTDFVDIVGTVDDPDGDLAEYRLQYRQMGARGAEWTTFATGDTPVVEDVLGTLDPTLMLNGMFEVRVLATDQAGWESTYSVHLVITGEQKIGHFRITFEDLNVPVSGFDLIVWRTYDSRDKRVGDFGVGWTMELTNVQVAENGFLGEGWKQTRGPGIIPMWCVRPTRPHIVTVSVPNGPVQQFVMGVSPDCQILVPIRFATLTFTPLPGTTSSLAPLAGTDVIIEGGPEGPIRLLDLDDLSIYDPLGYQLTTRDGTSLVIKEVTGLQSITDRNGNTLRFASGSITHSSGKRLTFQRDELGRITQITDPMGYTINYTYDARGDLVSVTDQEGNVTTFIYDDNHYLLEIRDPLGRTGVRTEYDEDGRVISSTDADGNRTNYTHDLDNKREIIAYPDGNQAIMEYDDWGNVISITDPLGNVWSNTYDDQGNMLTQTDPLGNTTTYTYDGQGNLLTVTTPLGDTYVNTYEEFSRLLTTTDPQGNTVTMAYDDVGNLTSITDPLGNTTTFTYDANGNRISETDPLGNTTRYTYNQFGDLTSRTDALGHKMTFTYDANGNKLSSTTTRTLADGSVETVTTRYVYDRLNQLVETTDAEGNTIAYSYDANGKLTTITDPLGRTIINGLTSRGQTGSVTFPDGTSDTYTYDARGFKTSFTDRAGRTTTYDYDAAGRLVKQTFPNGAVFELTYNAAGRTTAIKDARGKTHQFTQNASGFLTARQDALGNVTQYAYDANGRLTSFIDARGNEIRYEYDAAGRSTRRIFPDGTQITLEYDAAGRMIAQTDQAGRRTSYTYDAIGRLTAVTDALGNVTRYGYDEVGNLVSVTDARGNTTTFEYDNRRRKTRRTLPLGMFETWTYDENGNLISYTDFNGNTTTFAYNVNNQLVRKTFPDGTTEFFTYTVSGQLATVTDSRGTTTLEYNDRNRLIRRTEPDGRTISYTYDLAGKRTSVTTPEGTTTYAYDDLGRLQRVTDPDGGVTTYAYDGVGNLTGITYPNGNVTTLSYDSLNRITQIEHRTGGGILISSYTYTRDAVGNITRVVENTGRQVDYTYDDLNRLIEERIQDPVLGDEVIRYTYDAVGNRLTKTDSRGTTTYTYDANDRLVTETFTPALLRSGQSADGAVARSETDSSSSGLQQAVTTSYTYDANGNLLSRFVSMTDNTTYRYDVQGRLVGATITRDGTVTTVEYRYDWAGNRVQTIVNGTDVTNYLVDTSLDLPQVLLETDGAGTSLASYVYGLDLISQNRAGAASYYHYDATFSTRQLTDSTGAVTDSYTYDAFGLLRDATGATTNNYLFTGEQFDPHLNLYYLRARYLDPATGRFLSRDPMEGYPLQPQSFYPYVYAENNPLNRFDPSGRFTVAGMMVAVGVIGALAAAISIGAIAGGSHPLLWGASREETTAADRERIPRYFGWVQMSSSLDVNFAAPSFSEQLTVSRAWNTDVATRHREIVIELDVTGIEQTVQGIVLLATGLVLGGLANLQLQNLEPNAVDIALLASTLIAAFAALEYAVYLLEPSVGVSVGSAFLHNTYSSGQLDGLAIGIFGGEETPGLGFILAADLAFDLGINTDEEAIAEEGYWNGLVTAPNPSISAAFGISTGGLEGGFVIYWAIRIPTFQ